MNADFSGAEGDACDALIHNLAASNSSPCISTTPEHQSSKKNDQKRKKRKRSKKNKNKVKGEISETVRIKQEHMNESAVTAKADLGKSNLKSDHQIQGDAVTIKLEPKSEDGSSTINGSSPTREDLKKATTRIKRPMERILNLTAKGQRSLSKPD